MYANKKKNITKKAIKLIFHYLAKNVDIFLLIIYNNFCFYYVQITIITLKHKKLKRPVIFNVTFLRFFLLVLLKFSLNKQQSILNEVLFLFVSTNLLYNNIQIAIFN